MARAPKAEYQFQIHHLADCLINSDKPLDEVGVVDFVINGLVTKYDSVVVTIQGDSTITLNIQVFSKLLQHERKIKKESIASISSISDDPSFLVYLLSW